MKTKTGADEDDAMRGMSKSEKATEEPKNGLRLLKPTAPARGAARWTVSRAIVTRGGQGCRWLGMRKIFGVFQNGNEQALVTVAVSICLEAFGLGKCFAKLTFMKTKKPVLFTAVEDPRTARTHMLGRPVHKLPNRDVMKLCRPRLRVTGVATDSHVA